MQINVCGIPAGLKPADFTEGRAVCQIGNQPCRQFCPARSSSLNVQPL